MKSFKIVNNNSADAFFLSFGYINLLLLASEQSPRKLKQLLEDITTGNLRQLKILKLEESKREVYNIADVLQKLIE
jgi:hypothetical protein